MPNDETIETIELTGALDRISEDRDGETKVTLTIPLTELKHVLKLGEWVHCPLLVRITKD